MVDSIINIEQRKHAEIRNIKECIYIYIYIVGWAKRNFRFSKIDLFMNDLTMN